MKKNPGCVLILLFAAVVFVGCLGEKTKKNEMPTPSVIPKGSVMETITIYSVDSDTMSLIPVSVKKPKKELDGQAVVALVKENLNGIDIRITSVKQKRKKLFISFASNSIPVASCNKSMEKLILDCLSNSILDNVESCHQVIFQREGKAYRSEHRSFGIHEVYASK